MTATPQFDPLLATCPHCGAEPGKRCMAVCDWARKPHAVRRRLSLAMAAHADPLLDALWPHEDGCALCTGQGRDARFRRVEALAERMGAGECPEDVQADYPWVALEAVEAVRVWAQKWPGAW